MLAKRLGVVTAVILAAALALGLGCGGKKPKVEGEGGAKPAGGGTADGGKDPAPQSEAKAAEAQVASWLGKNASAKVAELAEKLAAQLGFKLADDPDVAAQIKKLTSAILGAAAVKKQTDDIADQATSGFFKKMKLGWKAIQAGGVDEYKKKVKDNTTRLATDAIEGHVKNVVLKDPRMAQLMKKFMPILQLEAKIAAIPMQQNMSPEASQKLLGIALKLSVAGKSKETADKVNAWSAACDPHMVEALEKLFQKLAGLKSVSKAFEGLAVDVVGHPTTAKELAAMMAKITADKGAHDAMVKAYENAAFENGDKAVRDSIDKILALPVVDNELFAAMDRLAAAPGAPAIIEKHFTVIGQDPEMAKLVDGFIIDVIQTCGDPAK